MLSYISATGLIYLILMIHCRKFNRHQSRRSYGATHKSSYCAIKLITDPIKSYEQFYQNQYNAHHNLPAFRQVCDDLKQKVGMFALTSPLAKRFNKLLLEQIEIQSAYTIHPVKMNKFMIEYVEALFELMKKFDPTLSLDQTYHTNFTKGQLTELLKPGDNTCLYFSFEDVSDLDLIQLRPLCMYYVQLFEPTDLTTAPRKSVEGSDLNMREFVFHDLGHAYIMKIHDLWLFSESKLSPVELVKEWVNNKNRLVQQMQLVHQTDRVLYKAILLWMFDIFHDRGYQFDLAIALQQFSAEKNLRNLQTKIKHNMFNGVFDPKSADKILEAQSWLVNLTKRLLFEDNLRKIQSYEPYGFLIKRYPSVSSLRGVPEKIIFSKNKIEVGFKCGYYMTTTTIYEIELLHTKPHPLTLNQIDLLYRAAGLVDSGHAEFVVFDENLNPLNVCLESFTPLTVLKPIVLFKIERLLSLMKSQTECNFCQTKNYDLFESDNLKTDSQHLLIDTGIALLLDSVTIEKKKSNLLKYVNTDPHARFVQTTDLRAAYLRNPTSPQIGSPNPFVTLPYQMELGMVNTIDHPSVALAVSSLLSRSIDRAKESRGGYLPDDIVERAQREYVSPYALSHLWGSMGRRFVLSMPVDSQVSEIIGTALISSTKSNLFFFTNKYNNVNWHEAKQIIDSDLMVDGTKWFDRFNMPNLSDYKINSYNQLANFSVDEFHRGEGLGKFMIDSIIRHYALHNPNLQQTHSQYMICGDGLFQIADPRWLPYMLRCGFKHRAGAETFYLETESNPLPKLSSFKSNVAYNQHCGIHDLYNSPLNTEFALVDRIPRVMHLANNPLAKLQYYQLYRSFKE